MELKLKRRVLKIDVYGDESEELRFPSYEENIDYSKALLDEEQDEKEVTTEFLKGLGMNVETVKMLEFPDMLEIIEVLSGQKKI